MIRVKVDASAGLSSLRACDFKVVRRRRSGIVRLMVHPILQDDARIVRSSCGHVSQRLVIESEAEIGGQRWPIEFKLTNRDEMGYRKLLVKQAIRRRCPVDPRMYYLVGLEQRKKKRVSPRTDATKGRHQ